MYAVPDVEEVVAVAKELGINLSSDEAVVYRKYLLDQLGALDTFVQSRIEEASPPMSSPARQPAFLPSPGEDPFNAWRWKCHIEGAPDAAQPFGASHQSQAPAVAARPGLLRRKADAVVVNRHPDPTVGILNPNAD